MPLALPLGTSPVSQSWLMLPCKGSYPRMTLLLLGCPASDIIGQHQKGHGHWDPVEEDLLTARGDSGKEAGAARLDGN